MNNERLKQSLNTLPKQLIRFKVWIFLAVVAIAYGFILWRAIDLANIAADQTAVHQQTTALQPHIDQATLQKIQELQDNSVNARALFDQARQNPFKE